MTTPQVTTHTLPSGWEAVQLRNGALEVTLLPQKGAEIYSLNALQHSGVDLLWKSPWGLRPPPVPSSSGPESQSVWLDYYAGGWQDLLPNAGGACTVDGAAHTFHGEASVVPWEYEIERPDGAAPRVRLSVRLARTPLLIEKLVSLDPHRPALRLWERVT